MREPNLLTSEEEYESKPQYLLPTTIEAFVFDLAFNNLYIS